MKLIFLYADKHQSFLQIDTVILMGMVKHSQISQNNKFAVSLQCLRKEVRDEVDFYMQINISFLQGDTIVLDGCDQAFPSYSK